MNNKLKKISPFLILNALIGFFLVFLIYNHQKKASLNEGILRDKTEPFVFTSPILDCEDINQGESKVLVYKDLEKKANALEEKYNLSNYSIYFRDLANGEWVGIREKQFFSPASLMKTPLLIAFLKGVEKNPELLKKQVIATDEYFNYAIQQNFEIKTKIIKGNTYTLEDLLSSMIIESDNVATLMLSKYINQSDYNDLLNAVGVRVEEKGKDVDIRVKDFAGFFRVLYNASYLNREMSELALSILSKSTFSEGLVAGVPKGTLVAHKYGERSIEQKQNGMTLIKEKQLHDCGIVYAKSKTYILCLMTKGEDFKKQEDFLAEISEFIYKQVSE